MAPPSEDENSDVELEGMEVDEGEDEAVEEAVEESANAAAAADDVPDDDSEEVHELEEARRERMELVAAEQKKLAAQQQPATAAERLEYILAQSDVFAHFLAGSVAATSKRGKNSRGKKNRLTEAEEDAQMLKSAQSKRSVIRLDKQPSILADHCKMHNYQLEGLNWLIKLHCNGINGILADEV